MTTIIQHDLKVWPEFFDAVLAGDKTFEVRKYDRPYAVGDVLTLREWDPSAADYTGRLLRMAVSYVLPGGQFGIEPGYCVMGLSSWLV